MRVMIIGAGIGGLSLALSLHAAGRRDVVLYESASAMRELGVGINLLPHAVRELSELGLADALAAEAIPTAELGFYTQRGQHIWTEPRGLAAGYRWPQYSIHRGRLLGILHRAVVERLGPQALHLGHHLEDFTEVGDVIEASFVDRRGGRECGRARADVLVGCDGIHSRVRRRLYPDEGPPRWNGITMWRGTTVG
ncbi:MAG: FAD-dependent monooxygenase, partial [Myxococcales bacterium]|nr:FAD-dependent monooxygenase [Myxococcales bacterium]